jgi:hypothetical protein
MEDQMAEKKDAATISVPTPEEASHLLQAALDAYAALYASDTKNVAYLNATAQLTNAQAQVAQASATRVP